MQEARNRRLSRWVRSCVASCLLPLVALILLTACSPAALEAASPLPTAEAPLLPTRTLMPTETPLSPTPQPTVTPVPTLMPTVAPSIDGWREVRSGLQLREMYRDDKAQTGKVMVVRVDPTSVDFHILYQPTAPLHVSEWYSNSQALLVMNSSFFDQARHVVGQITTDGVSGGAPHSRMEGAFYLTAVGATV